MRFFNSSASYRLMSIFLQSTKEILMIFLEIILLFGCIIYAAKLGGIGVGMAGGLGMAIAVFVLGLKPGAIPIDVILIILSVIFAISCMQLAGGMDYMVKLASKLLRSNPKYINILAPAVTFVLTVLGGTGYTAMSVLNVIQEVAKENHVRPSQPLTSAVIASQIAITASPISAATAAMYVVVEKMGGLFRSGFSCYRSFRSFRCHCYSHYFQYAGGRSGQSPHLPKETQRRFSLDED